VGDPACDLIVSWTFLNADSRAVFRAAFSHDDPVRAAGARRFVDDLIADYRAA
jgi:aminoglycoside phosphotransferase (APT) family kinase protein